MVLHITHFTSVEANRNFYLRFTSEAYWDEGFKSELAKLHQYHSHDANWIPSYLWADGKRGAWRVKEHVWNAILDDFDNGLQANNEEHERVAKIKQEAATRDEEFMREQARTFASAGAGGYTADFIEGIMAAFSAGNEERLKREAAWRSQGYWVPRSGVFIVKIDEEAPAAPPPPKSEPKIVTPDLMVESEHRFVEPIQTVGEALSILGLKQKPSAADLKKAYYALARTYQHPEHAAKMRRVNMARDIVKRNYNL